MSERMSFCRLSGEEAGQYHILNPIADAQYRLRRNSCKHVCAQVCMGRWVWPSVYVWVHCRAMKCILQSEVSMYVHVYVCIDERMDG